MIDIRFVPIAKWPSAETKARRNAQFRVSYLKTLDLLEAELKKLNARELVIEAFYTRDQIRNDGWPRANQNPSHPGVILSFKAPQGEPFMKDGKRMVNLASLSFPCDTYFHIEHNIHAIALSLQALRAVDRYGVTKRSEQYAGWKRIEAPAPPPISSFGSAEEAAAFLISATGDEPTQVRVNVTITNRESRETLHRRAARRLHPDSPTGSHELFVKLQQAMEFLESVA